MAERERIPLEYQPQLADEYETDVPPEDESYSLEEILEEYGGGLERKLSEGAAEPAEPLEEEKRRGGLRSGLASLAGKVKRKRPETPEQEVRPPEEPETPDRLEPVRSEPDGGAEPPDDFPVQPETPEELEEPEEPDAAQPSFTERARETAERAGHVLDILRGLPGRLKEPLRQAAAAVRRVLGRIHLPALPSGTRIPVLSAVGDRIEAARRKRRPKRNRGQPVPIPGRRKKKRPPEAAVDGMEPADGTAEDEKPAPVEPETPKAAQSDTTSPDTVEQAEALHAEETDSTEPPDAEERISEPSGAEEDSAKPSDAEETISEPSGAEEDNPKPPDTEETISEPSGAEEDSPKPPDAEDDIPEPPNVETDSPNPSSAETDGPASRGPEKNAPPQAAERHPRRSLFQRLAALRLLLQKRRNADEGPVGPEIPLHDAAARFREAYTRRQVPPLALAAGGLPTLLLLLEWLGISVPLWTDVIPFRCFLTLLCIAGTAYLCRQVFTGSVTAFACGVSAAAAGCDCLVRMVSVTRSPGDGFGAVACLSLIVAQWGVSLESRGRFEAFRAASLDDDPPYLVTDMAQGACKQKGATPGFYSTAMRPDVSTIWQTILLPLTLTVSLVLAGISSFGRDRPADFFLNWSAILAAGATFTLALCWGLPWAHLARRLQKSGGAVAGWAGAEKIARQKNMIVTDGDLFPPGAVQLNGIRLFGGDMDVAVSYAAAMTREAACGLERPFDELLHTELGEGAAAPEAEEFNFYEEGGYGAVINGEPVLMGTAAFLRRMGVLLPRDLRVPSGMFLAVEHRLLAVFAIRYNPADNVDYALRMMRRSGVTPLLAVRDPNITPAMLQRKFRRRIPARYPDLAGRIALSEVEFDRDAPRALLFREGLLPYAEAVVGCRRLCGGVRRAAILSEFGSAAGMFLTFFLCYQAKFALLTPLSLTVFLLLWLLPVLLVMELF